MIVSITHVPRAVALGPASIIAIIKIVEEQHQIALCFGTEGDKPRQQSEQHEASLESGVHDRLLCCVNSHVSLQVIRTHHVLYLQR
jgi:hypothetical protein